MKKALAFQFAVLMSVSLVANTVAYARTTHP